MKKPTNVKQFLKQARDIIEKNGHCKGTLKDAQGRVCAIGAMLEVKAPHLYSDARKELQATLDERMQKKGLMPQGLMGFNDSSSTRKAQVIGLFNRAIKNLEK